MTVLAARLAAFLSDGSAAAQVAPVYYGHDLRSLSSRSRFDVEFVANNRGKWDLRRDVVLLMVANVRP